MLGAQNINGRSENEMDGFRAEVSHALRTEGVEFLDSIVTGDETRGFHHTPEPKQQSLQWRQIHSSRTKVQNFNFSEKIHGVRFVGQKRHSPGRLHASWRNI